jgi:hypothetical protein
VDANAHHYQQSAYHITTNDATRVAEIQRAAQEAAEAALEAAKIAERQRLERIAAEAGHAARMGWSGQGR